MGSCDKCGHTHVTKKGGPACRAHKRSGQPCTNPPMTGQAVCRMHGGSAPQARAAAEQRVQRAELAKTIGELADACDVASTDPVDQLQEALEVCVRMVAALDYLTSRLGLGIGEGADATGHILMPAKAGAATNPLVTELGTWVDRKARTAKACLDAGISERQVRVMEATAGSFVQALRAILDGLGLTPDQQALVPSLVRAAMEAIPVEAGS
jgi:hypothetical protein